jgi:hypothetical protein
MPRLRLWHVVIFSIFYWWGMGHLLESRHNPTSETVPVPHDASVGYVIVGGEDTQLQPGWHWWVMMLPPVALLILWRAVGRERARPPA